jgi:hypothetical protein
MDGVGVVKVSLRKSLAAGDAVEFVILVFVMVHLAK